MPEAFLPISSSLVPVVFHFPVMPLINGALWGLKKKICLPASQASPLASLLPALLLLLLMHMYYLSYTLVICTIIFLPANNDNMLAICIFLTLLGGQGKNKYCEYCIFTVPRIQLSFAIATMKIILNAEIHLYNIASRLQMKYLQLVGIYVADVLVEFILYFELTYYYHPSKHVTF